MKVTLKYPRKARIEMIPLMDVIFLLLVAFIMMTMSMTIHRGVPVELPASEQADLEKKSLVTVTLMEDGTLYLDREEVSLADLGNRLARLAETGRPPRVFLAGDKRAVYERVLAVIDEIRKAGVTGISLETRWEK